MVRCLSNSFVSGNWPCLFRSHTHSKKRPVAPFAPAHTHREGPRHGVKHVFTYGPHETHLGFMDHSQRLISGPEMGVESLLPREITKLSEGWGFGMMPGWLTILLASRHLAFVLSLSPFLLCRRRCPSASHHFVPSLSLLGLSLPPCTAFLCLGTQLLSQNTILLMRSWE